MGFLQVFQYSTISESRLDMGGVSSTAKGVKMMVEAQALKPRRTKAELLEVMAATKYSHLIGEVFGHDGARCKAWELKTFGKCFADMGTEDYKYGALLLHVMAAKKIYDGGTSNV